MRESRDIDRITYLSCSWKFFESRERSSSIFLSLFFFFFSKSNRGVGCFDRKRSRAINLGSGTTDIIFAHPPLLLLISSTHETYSFPLCRLIRRIYGALIQSASSSVFYRKRKEKKKREKTFIILTPVRKPNLVIQRYFSSESTVFLGRRTRYFIVVQCGFKILNQYENFVLPLYLRME